MPKTRTVYICSSCASESSHWFGQCASCSEWNTCTEDVVVTAKSSKISGGFGGRSLSSGGRSLGSGGVKPVRLSKLSSKPPKRISSKIPEFDRVLGGGFVPGQVILLGGAPGIGKSTLLTEIAKTLKGTNVLYVCGEESADQIKLRTSRMKYDAENLLMLPETNVESIVGTVESYSGGGSGPDADKLGLIIVDSIQTLYSEDFSGIAGSVSQVKGCSQMLTNAAKSVGIPMVLVGHVTKQGTVAGPKILEHIVDTVLYLEGDTQHLFRLLRTEKNRFGPVSEIGVFEMVENGLNGVNNPSEMFLAEMAENSSGSVVTVVMEGHRPILFEVQALTVRTSFGYPRRTTSGFNSNRLQVLIATLEKRAGLNLGNHDVYVSVAGGFKVSEYSADLAVCMAIASSLEDKPLKPKTAVFGECGLGGEIRKVPHAEKRVSEAKKLGYSNIVSPKNAKNLRRAISLSL